MKKWLESNSVPLKGDVYIVDVETVKNNRSYCVRLNNNKLFVDSFQDSISIPVVNNDDSFLVINYVGDEGDYQFDTTGDGDMDYDMVSMDWFPDTVLKAIDALKDENSGIDVTSSDFTYGAGRNG